MSIRNKRLIKELIKLPDITINDEWQYEPIVTLTRKNNMNHIFIKIDNRYPFSVPKLYIQEINSKPIIYIDWFLKDRNKFTKLVNELNIKIECICCMTMTCAWSPISGIKDIINEFDNHYNKYYQLKKFLIIYNKITGFDNLIYKNILDFLY